MLQTLGKYSDYKSSYNALPAIKKYIFHVVCFSLFIQINVPLLVYYVPFFLELFMAASISKHTTNHFQKSLSGTPPFIPKSKVLIGKGIVILFSS